MLSYKFKQKKYIFLFLFLVLVKNAFAEKFSSKECLDAEYSTLIKHEGKFFGLIKNELNIKKNKCIIEVKFKNILEKKWLIDVCREPIHIKLTAKGGQSVYKRTSNCTSSSEIEFCQYKKELKDVLQDYGLIFAEGEREILTSAHGQTYCSYMLVKKYLDDGILFSKFDVPNNIFENSELPAVITKPKPSVVAPSIIPLGTAHEKLIHERTNQQDNLHQNNLNDDSMNKKNESSDSESSVQKF